jgi:hypothetical protein
MAQDENPNARDLKRDLEDVELNRASIVPDDVPDPVETRDPASQAVPRTVGRAWLFALPIFALALIGLIWLFGSERGRDGQRAGDTVGTTGVTAPEAGWPGGPSPDGPPRGDEAPLNPGVHAGVPPVITSLGHLVQKEDYVGQPVEIRAIPVGDVKGPRTFEVGRLGNRTLVVVDGDAAIVPSLERGQIVQLSGRLESAEDVEPPANLSDEDRRALDGAGVFIRATAVSVPEQDAGGRDATIPEMERTVPQPERGEAPYVPRQDGPAQLNTPDPGRGQSPAPPGARQEGPGAPQQGAQQPNRQGGEQQGAGSQQQGGEPQRPQ